MFFDLFILLFYFIVRSCYFICILDNITIFLYGSVFDYYLFFYQINTFSEENMVLIFQLISLTWNVDIIVDKQR